MKLSDRDKKLLSFVLGLLLIFCAYFFGFRNLTAKNEELDEVIKEDREYYNNLKQMVDLEGRYIEDTETFNAGYLDLLNRFDTGLTQEHSILFVSDESIIFEMSLIFSSVSLWKTIISSIRFINSGRR